MYRSPISLTYKSRPCLTLRRSDLDPQRGPVSYSMQQAGKNFFGMPPETAHNRLSACVALTKFDELEVNYIFIIYKTLTLPAECMACN